MGFLLFTFFKVRSLDLIWFRSEGSDVLYLFESSAPLFGNKKGMYSVNNVYDLVCQSVKIKIC